MLKYISVFLYLFFWPSAVGSIFVFGIQAKSDSYIALGGPFGICIIARYKSIRLTLLRRGDILHAPRRPQGVHRVYTGSTRVQTCVVGITGMGVPRVPCEVAN